MRDLQSSQLLPQAQKVDGPWVFPRGAVLLIVEGFSNNALVQHGFSYLVECGDVGSSHIIDKAILLAETDALIMNGLHDPEQTGLYLIVAPLQSHAVLGHL